MTIFGGTYLKGSCQLVFLSHSLLRPHLHVTLAFLCRVGRDPPGLPQVDILLMHLLVHRMFVETDSRKDWGGGESGRVFTAALNGKKIWQAPPGGHAVVKYSYPVDVVQIIFMMNHQLPQNRTMMVKYDKQARQTSEDPCQLLGRLQEGLIFPNNSDNQPLRDLKKRRRMQLGEALETPPPNLVTPTEKETDNCGKRKSKFKKHIRKRQRS